MISKVLKRAIESATKQAEKEGINEFSLEMVLLRILRAKNIKLIFEELNIEDKTIFSIIGHLKYEIKRFIDDKKEKQVEEDIFEDKITGDFYYVDIMARSQLSYKAYGLKEIDEIVFLDSILYSENTVSYDLLSEIISRDETYKILKGLAYYSSLEEIEKTGKSPLESALQKMDEDVFYYLDKLENGISDLQQDLHILKEEGLEKNDISDLQEDEVLGVGFDNLDDAIKSIENKDEEDSLQKNNILIDLLEKAKEKKFDQLTGREKEISQMELILSRKTKNNPILTGKEGVGKTAIVYGFANNMVKGDVPFELIDRPLYQLDIGALLAGTIYRGQFEKRLLNVIQRAKDESAILFIDEIHTILGSGSGGGNLDLANMLKPHLSDGSLSIIGATTDDEYAVIFNKDKALSRRFNEINVKEPTVNETKYILEQAIPTYSAYHDITITKEITDEIVELSNRYITGRKFPDKGLDLLDELCAFTKLKNEENRIVDINDLYSIISKKTGIPAESMKAEPETKILELEDSLKKNVFGQDHAIKELSDSIMMSYAGLNKPNKPLGSFLFIGPTGVGKTEIVKTLSNQLDMNLVRFDMSEYMDQTSINKLLGSNKGYIGYDEQSLLNEKLSKNPYSIVLFDEFEKAHSSIKNILLPILDEGFIFDSHGEKINFNNTIIVFTSNCGVATTNSEKNSMGFLTTHHATKINMDEIKKEFPPEWRNRLTNIIQFNELDRDIIKLVAKKEIKNLKALLLESKGIKLEVSNTVINKIIDDGFDPELGARPIERKVVELISKPLSKIILMKSLKKENVIKVKVSKDKIIFE